MKGKVEKWRRIWRKG